MVARDGIEPPTPAFSGLYSPKTSIATSTSAGIPSPQFSSQSPSIFVYFRPRIRSHPAHTASVCSLAVRTARIPATARISSLLQPARSPKPGTVPGVDTITVGHPGSSPFADLSRGPIEKATIRLGQHDVHTFQPGGRCSGCPPLNFSCVQRLEETRAGTALFS